MRASARERAARAARFAAPAPCDGGPAALSASPSAVKAARRAALKRKRRGSSDLEDTATHYGHCEHLEKTYLRLTGAVDWSKIRPPRVLKESLEMVKQRWKKEKDYNFASSQLKSIRQDLTVQRCAENERWLLLCIQVYETNARISLESADLEEMHQCLSVLDDLHAHGEKCTRDREVCIQFRDEFAAYRVLHAIHAENTFFLNTARDLAARSRQSIALAHAFAVLAAVRRNAYVRFFELHESAPNMSGFLMDHMLQRVRRNAFQALLKSSYPELDLKIVQEQLRFHDGRQRAEGDMRKFLDRYELEYVYIKSRKGKRFPRAINVQALKKGSSSSSTKTR
ncbi:Leukocyte receptor cluster member 8-like [Hondaea fermentalgiana]|uniref:Leukocyte receptor cluster member 8-like n=1 Tax=Hondaea fermentalgiana TaxID=2315210 RepID=A0A2R5G4I5_9STRA|nr:Leukocyte receptor cluster member 8-like [Hondaea fermentalgiana]|eukprot:GBG25936.1 Leukocyte receptor cluster member 8-like [Hondaea fermentalgiana]